MKFIAKISLTETDIKEFEVEAQSETEALRKLSMRFPAYYIDDIKRTEPAYYRGIDND